LISKYALRFDIDIDKNDTKDDKRHGAGITKKARVF